MIIMLFGISNVGKTVTGEKLAKKLKYPFFDLDEEIKRRLQKSYFLMKETGFTIS